MKTLHVVNRKPRPNALASNANPIELCRLVGRSGLNGVPASQAAFLS
jgi:hypothetical protein